MTDDRTLLQRLWNLGCSLKLAIYVASLATLLIMGGSLVMPAHPEIFGGMDAAPIGEWFAGAWARAPQLLWWLPLTALCLVIFGLNTLCCLVDWLIHLKARWRKAGEYLIHSGFLLLLVGYLWGNLAGFRSGPHRLAAGETLQLPTTQYALRLERFAPDFSAEGRPLDLVNEVALLHAGQEVARGTVRFNHPLLHDGLVILATSLDQRLTGFRCFLPGIGMVDLAPGSRVALPDGHTLGVLNLLADARQTGDGRVIPVGERLGNPAMQLLLLRPDGSSWQGWYFLREAPPLPLATTTGAAPQPLQPLAGYVSLLTVNRDPGAGLALAGGGCLTVGVLFAMLSFYRKRARGDRPQV